MPEESFEQQARRKTEEFNMAPAPEIWQRIEVAIAPKERKRRILIWWWLLPLCLAGGGIGVLLMEKDRSSSKNEVSVVVGNDKRVEKGTLQSIPEERNEKIEQSRVLVKKKGDEKEEKNRLKARDVNGLDDKLGVQKSVTGKMRGELIETEDKEAYKEIVVEAETDIVKKHEEKGLISGKQDFVLQNGGANQSLNDSVSKGTSIATSDSLTQAKETKPDTMSFAANLALSNKGNADSASKKKIKSLNKHWQFGAMAELGLVTWGKGLLSVEKSSQNAVSSLPANDISRDSLMNLGTTSHQTKNGRSLDLGFIMRKDLSHRFYFTTQLGYQYQQYRVYQILQVATPQPLNYTFSYLIGANDYHSHFLNFGTNAGAKLLAGRHNALSAEVGIHNGFLFSVRKTGADSSTFTRNNNNLTANFYRWQPQLSVALPFDWHKGNTIKFQVLPFARLGLNAFQKNGSSYKDNHLVSAGIQAVYFFK